MEGKSDSINEKRVLKDGSEKFCSECGEIISKKAEICPKCGVRQLGAQNTASSIIKQILKWILIIFLIFFIIGFIAGIADDEGESYDDSSSLSLNDETALTISPRALYSAYESNEVAADANYKGKLLEVTGTIESINSDIADEAVIQLSAGGLWETVSAEGDMNFTQAAVNLHKGHRVTLICRGAGEILGSPMIDECSIQ